LTFIVRLNLVIRPRARNEQTPVLQFEFCQFIPRSSTPLCDLEESVLIQGPTRSSKVPHKKS
jgi:hypothetical protein